jgi:hypothetical protein
VQLNLEKPAIKLDKRNLDGGRIEVSQQEHHDEDEAIPELLLIREIVQRHMPVGHRLSNIDLTIGTIDDEGNEPRFVVLVELTQEAQAPEPFGWADKMAKVIRQKWPKDVFDVKVKIIMA